MDNSPPPAVPIDEGLERLIGEMTAQASLGHKLFCVGIHQHDSGEVEEEWIEWSDAFAKLGVRHQELISEARAEGAQDTTRIDWLDEGDNFFLVTPATNMIGIRKGWTHRVGRSLDSIGERCLDIREAIDKAREASDDR